MSEMGVAGMAGTTGTTGTAETVRRTGTPRQNGDAQGAAGNAAALREALAGLLAWCEAHSGACAIRVAPVPDDEAAVWDERDRAMERARAALAAPPRNCDVGTAEEQAKRFAKFCEKYHSRYDDEFWCSKWPLSANNLDCEFYWGQLPGPKCTDGMHGVPDCRGCRVHCADMRKGGAGAQGPQGEQGRKGGEGWA